jgi:hypothetical protein
MKKGGKTEKIEKFGKTKVKDEAYSGLGHKDGSLSFFPFSAGERSCPARTLGLQVIRKVREEGLVFLISVYSTYWTHCTYLCLTECVLLSVCC